MTPNNTINEKVYGMKLTTRGRGAVAQIGEIGQGKV